MADTRLGTCYRMRVDSLLELIDAFDAEVAFLSDAIAARLRHHPGYHASQQIPGVAPVCMATPVITKRPGAPSRLSSALMASKTMESP